MRRDKPTRYEDFQWAIKLNRFGLNILGIWPHIHTNVYHKLLSDLRVVTYVFLFVFIGVVPGFHALVKNWGDMMAMIDNLQFTLPILSVTMKLVIIWWKKSDLMLVLNMIAYDWSKPKTSREFHVMVARARIARIITIFGYSTVGLGFILTSCLPFFGISVRYTTNITDSGKLLPLQSHYFYDKDRSPYFELTYVAQIFTFFIAGLSYSSVDNLLGLLILHLCGQIENLQGKFMDINQFENFDSAVAFIVQDHARLINYVNIIESIFNLLLLGLILYFGIVFCLSGFLVIMVLTQGREMSVLRLIMLITAVLIICSHTCLYCVVGEILASQCEEFYHAAYNYEWYTLKPQEMKSLILIINRASRPLYITAGKILPMTMSMFCNLMKTSAGYISVLLAK